MQKQGIVVDTESGYAKVAFVRSSGCGGNCKSCAGCEAKPHLVSLKNTVNAKVGDQVEVEMNAGKAMRFTLLLYIIPLIFFLAGTLISATIIGSDVANFEIYSFFIGILTFLFSLVILRLIDKRYGNQEATQLELRKII